MDRLQENPPAAFVAASRSRCYLHVEPAKVAAFCRQYYSVFRPLDTKQIVLIQLEPMDTELLFDRYIHLKVRFRNYFQTISVKSMTWQISTYHPLECVSALLGIH